MTTTWGSLAKDQTHSQTVNEAITEAINNHEADSEAHLGAGESLQSHKASDIIDHALGSVLADKLSLDEDIIEINFESLDAFTTAGDALLFDGPLLKLYIEDNPVPESTAYCTIVSDGNYLDFSKDLLFQFSAWTDMASNFKAYFILGNYQASENHWGFGFRWIGSEVKAFLQDDTTTTYTSDFSIDNTVMHVYRAQWVASEKKIYFFVDGVQKGTITITTPEGASEPILIFKAKTNGVIDGSVFIRKVRISRGQ